MATVTSEHIPTHSRRAWILTGYRPVGTSFQSCIKSMFRTHNETGNIWSHVFGCFYFFHQGCALATLNHTGEWNHTKVLTYWAFSLAILFCSSVVAHTFNCISVNSRKICFMVDYLGISIHCCGCAMAYHAFFSSDLFVGLTKDLYLPASAAEIILATVICCWSLVRMPTWNYGTACRGCAFGLPYFGGSLPVFAYTAMFFGQTEKTTRICLIFLRHLFLYVTGTTIYGLCIPERIFPKTFDIWGHSHQFFHVIVIFGARDQYLLLCEFMKIPEELPEINISQILFWMLTTAIICLFIVIYYIIDVVTFQNKNKDDRVANNNNIPKDNRRLSLSRLLPARKDALSFLRIRPLRTL